LRDFEKYEIAKLQKQKSAARKREKTKALETVEAPLLCSIVALIMGRRNE